MACCYWVPSWEFIRLKEKYISPPWYWGLANYGFTYLVFFFFFFSLVTPFWSEVEIHFLNYSCLFIFFVLRIILSICRNNRKRKKKQKQKTFLTTPWYMELLGQGSDLSCSLDLSQNCGNSRSLTHCSRLGIKPTSQCSQDTNHIVSRFVSAYRIFFPILSSNWLLYVYMKIWRLFYFIC